MLAFALIVALTASSALGKPTGNCIFLCEPQMGGITGTSGAYTQPGFGQAAMGFGQAGRSFDQMSSGFGQIGGNFGQGAYSSGYIRPAMGFAPTHGNLEDFGTETVYQQRPSFRQAQQTGVISQVPVQPQIDGMFTHSSSKASYESNQGYLKIHQPGVTNTVISEPIRRPRPARICQDVYDPCV